MKHEEVLKMMGEMGLPFAYDHFVQGESPEPYAGWYKSVYLPEPKAVDAETEGQG